MTGDDESFLTRWSRRKREVETKSPAQAPPADGLTAPAPCGQPAPEPPDVLDIIAELPPLEEITAATDIRAFLAPGVPAELRLAALRRAWSADPAIRDFVGLAENQWDFTAPDSVPGFASRIDPEQVLRLLNKVVGGDETQASSPASPSPAEIASAADELNATVASSSPPAPATVGSDESKSVVEEHHDTSNASLRRHGGALPT